MERKDSVYITGSGKIDGGAYDEIKIMGSARVNGDVEANTVHTAGSAQFSGNVKALNVHTAGACRISGQVTAGDFKTAGSCSVEGDVRATRFACSGSQQVGGSLVAGSIKISGACKVGKDVEADQFYSKGRFTVEGLLSADQIKVELGRFGSGCRAREIGGERIEVRGGGPCWEWDAEELELKLGKVGHKLEQGLGHLRDRFGIGIEIGDIDKLVEEIVKFGEKVRANIEVKLDDAAQAALEVDVIEGDQIVLEHTRAKVVRGKEITIGPGCVIERVEYSVTLHVDEGAQVGAQEKV